MQGKSAGPVWVKATFKGIKGCSVRNLDEKVACWVAWVSYGHMYYNNYCYFSARGNGRTAAPGSPVQLLCEPWVLHVVCWFL